VIEKATELGAHEIIPMRSERSLVDPGKNKMLRWQKILVTAMKQSRRSVLPGFREVTTFETIIEASGSYDEKIIFHERSDLPFREYVLGGASERSFQRILLLNGPEGGFTDRETAQAAEHGFICLSMGARRLRAETAAVAAVTLFSNLSSR
jgi:16S rRNA (uracil1498-N3)-methyltransferase